MFYTEGSKTHNKIEIAGAQNDIQWFKHFFNDNPHCFGFNLMLIASRFPAFACQFFVSKITRESTQISRSSLDYAFAS